MKTSLVIGGAGFIGRRLVKKLLYTTKVVVVDNFTRSKYTDVPKGAEIITGNAFSDNVLNTSFEKYKPSYVFLFSSRPMDPDGFYDPLLEREVHERIAVSVVRCIKKFKCVEHVFFASSSRAEKSVGNTFRSIENFLSEMSETFNFRFSSLRYFSIIGNRDYMNPVEDLVSFVYQQLKNGERVVLFRPNSKLDFLHVDDAADATYLAFLHEISSGNNLVGFIDIGSGKGTTIKDVCVKLYDKLGVKKDFLVMNKDEIDDYVANIKFFDEIGWAPKITLDDYINDIL